MKNARSQSPVRRAAKTTTPPDLSSYTAASVPIAFLSDLAQLADVQGIAIEPWLVGLGLTRAQIDDAAVRVSYRQISLIIKRALRAFAQGDLGMRVGAHQTVGTFGVLGLAMMTAATFGAAIQIGVEHAAITGAMMDLELEPAGKNAIALVAQPRFPDDAILIFLCEELFASTLILARSLVGASFCPARVELTYPAPRHAAEYRRLFGCEIVFGARRNCVIVERRWLEMPLPTHHPISAQQALAICRDQAAQLKRQSEIVASVERVVRRRLAERPTLNDVAQTLNLSARSLRRHLAAAGHVFRGIHDHLRTQRALELLSAGALSIADIGTEVGFSDAREFRRAFKRWTGSAPTAMRHAHADE
jgi:AraC-like DNA-binding protein